MLDALPVTHQNTEWGWNLHYTAPIHKQKQDVASTVHEYKTYPADNSVPWRLQAFAVNKTTIGRKYFPAPSKWYADTLCNSPVSVYNSYTTSSWNNTKQNVVQLNNSEKLLIKHQIFVQFSYRRHKYKSGSTDSFIFFIFI